ncbi:hypothetical protein FB645_006079 [Coemansia sp. IMI 203386]|nr:hypothetical protein FB645_006079 [Coemansia sp. IMI 203386]
MENVFTGGALSSDMDGSQSTGKINRIIRRLSNKVTPPRLLSLRSRRGLVQPQTLDLEANLTEHEIIPSPVIASVSNSDNLLANASETTERGKNSVREDSLRKREKIAELRRRRQQRTSTVVVAEDGVENTTPSRVNSSGAARHLTSLFRLSPRQVVVSSGGSPMEKTHESGSNMLMEPMERIDGKRFMSMVTPAAEEGFFNSPELNLLLHQVELDPLIEPAAARPEPTLDDVAVVQEMSRGGGQTRGLEAKSMRRANSHNGYLTAGDAANKGEADFTINIPSTSLSPVVHFGGWPRMLSAHLRGRSRTVAQISEKKISDSGGVAGHHDLAGKRAAVADGTDVEAFGEDIDDILSQLEKEMEINATLRRDLANVNLVAGQLVRILKGSTDSTSIING